MNFYKNTKVLVDYVDTAEQESSFISVSLKEYKPKLHTHLEIHPSLILSVLGNMIIFAENNQLPRDLFSCGQSKQAVSLYSSNYLNRIDKMGVTLNSGQIPIVKSRYLDYVTKEEHPYGENAIVAIACYSSYNVEDALIFNEASLKRGLFRTTYYNMYQSKEESSSVAGSVVDSKFCDVQSLNVVRQKPGYDYGYLDENGLIKENTKLNDKMIVIGKCTSSSEEPGLYYDESVAPKKGQLGYVDKAFITEGEEGFNIAKVRIREDRTPAIGDKFCSRAGQKGTVGIILKEEDMPFTAEGIRPDIIVNPHALPSRMTIGHLVECLVGKACCLYGGYGDCTPFVNNGPQDKIFGEMLTNEGFHKSGNEILYNGMTGEQLETEIYFGPNYYLRLKHMVKDKINYRARGPRTVLTRQTVHGRAKDGGLRVGEMERDTLIAHGLSRFLQESMMERGDDYYMAVCNKTGSIAIYNENKNIFLSPLADGPIEFTGTLDGNMHIQNVSKHGQNFSIVRVPYTFKLLMQELGAMNISMRIITEDNIDQLVTLNYDRKQIELNTDVSSYSELLDVYKGIQEDGTISQIDKTPSDIDAAEFDIGAQESKVDVAPTSPDFPPTSPTDFAPKSPTDRKIHRVAIVVPFRHQPKLEEMEGQNRLAQKDKFIDHMKFFIQKVSEYAEKEMNITLIMDIFIIEQSRDGKKFNRGALLNSGFIHSQKKHYYTSIIAHDVDLLPRDSMIPYYARASFLNANQKPVIHLAAKWGRYENLGKTYIGGVTAFKSEFFNEVNGFPNYFSGWGGEDDALRARIILRERMENPALTPKDNEMVLDTYIEYPQDMPANGLIDLENISEYQQKRDILKSDEEFENMIKREARDLDKKIWQVNGLVNPREYGALFTINEDRVINPQYDMRELNVELNKDLTNYEIMFTKLGSLSREEIDTVDVTPKMRFKEPETKTPQALSPVYEIKTPDTPATPAMQTIPSEQSMQPTSPVYAPTSPAFAPTSPPLAPTTPTTPTSMPSSPVYAPTSPELSQETQQGGGIVPVQMNYHLDQL